MIARKIKNIIDYLLKLIGYKLIKRPKKLRKTISMKSTSELSFEFLKKQSTNKGSFSVIYFLIGEKGIDLLLNSLLSLKRHYSGRISIYTNLRNNFALNELIKLDVNIVIIDFKHDNLDFESFGSDGFVQIMKNKWPIIIQEMKVSKSAVLYLDLDTVILSDFTNYFEELNDHELIAFQSESERNFIPELCAGVMFFSLRSMEILENIHIDQSNHDIMDQDLINYSYKTNIFFKNSVFILPESLFQNGKYASHHIINASESDYLIPKLSPYLFHANYVSGLEKKVELLKTCGLWND
jgi:hypothetical protein